MSQIFNLFYLALHLGEVPQPASRGWGFQHTNSDGLIRLGLRHAYANGICRFIRYCLHSEQALCFGLTQRHQPGVRLPQTQITLGGNPHGV